MFLTLHNGMNGSLVMVKPEKIFCMTEGAQYKETWISIEGRPKMIVVKESIEEINEMIEKAK